MQIKYVGPFAAVEVDGVGVVQRDEVVTVAAVLGESLCQQVANWQPVKTKTKEA